MHCKSRMRWVAGERVTPICLFRHSQCFRNVPVNKSCIIRYYFPSCVCCEGRSTSDQKAEMYDTRYTSLLRAIKPTRREALTQASGAAHLVLVYVTNDETSKIRRAQKHRLAPKPRLTCEPKILVQRQYNNEIYNMSKEAEYSPSYATRVGRPTHPNARCGVLYPFCCFSFAMLVRFPLPRLLPLLYCCGGTHSSGGS